MSRAAYLFLSLLLFFPLALGVIAYKIISKQREEDLIDDLHEELEEKIREVKFQLNQEFKNRLNQ